MGGLVGWLVGGSILATASQLGRDKSGWIIAIKVWRQWRGIMQLKIRSHDAVVACRFGLHKWKSSPGAMMLYHASHWWQRWDYTTGNPLGWRHTFVGLDYKNFTVFSNYTSEWCWFVSDWNSRLKIQHGKSRNIYEWLFHFFHHWPEVAEVEVVGKRCQQTIAPLLTVFLSVQSGHKISTYFRGAGVLQVSY